MTAAPIIQGWCPGALRPMPSGDGLVVRLRPPGGVLSPRQSAGIAALAARFGNGLMDLSSRANVQLRGVSEGTHPPLIEGLRDLGLVDPTPEAEALRNIIVSPFWAPGDGTQELATNLAATLAASGLGLPSKFGFAVDTGPAPVLRETSADIRIERQGTNLFLVRADGMATGGLASMSDVVATALDLAVWFASRGISGGRGRMRDLIASGDQPPPMFRSTPMMDVADHTVLPGPCDHGTLVAFEFGQTDAATFARIGALGPLRLTPWRMVLLETGEVPDIPGLITDPSHPSLRVTACTGAPGCLQAHQPTRDLARRLAPLVPVALHVSGCGKGCAHPKPAALVLTATPQGFTIARNSKATTEGSSYPATALPPLLTEIP